jgi:hypothetical protein
MTINLEPKVYAANRAETGARVFVYQGKASVELSPEPSQAVRNHSPEGFSWGYGGSGPAQLALAILMDYFGNTVSPEEMVDSGLYHRFKDHFLLNSPDEGFRIREEEIYEWVAAAGKYEP